MLSPLSTHSHPILLVVSLSPNNLKTLLHLDILPIPSYQGEACTNPSRPFSNPSTSTCTFGKILTPEEISKQCQLYVPPKTSQCNHWDTSVYMQWAQQSHSDPMVQEVCPLDLLSTVYPPQTVDYWLATFVLEARHKDGQFYPPNTVKNILAALSPMA